MGSASSSSGVRRPGCAGSPGRAPAWSPSSRPGRAASRRRPGTRSIWVFLSAMSPRTCWRIAAGSARGRPAAGALVVPHQVHSTVTRWVGEAEAGRGALDRRHGHRGLRRAAHRRARSRAWRSAWADCMPVVIAAAGDDGVVLAAVHAGWRGALEGIVGRAAVELAAAAACSARSWDRASGPAASSSTKRSGPASPPVSPAWCAGMLSTLGGRDRRPRGAGVPSGDITVAGICSAGDERSSRTVATMG